jgi:predicted RNA binding protein YcfA (HicA-like mRNA interferase family)
MCTGHPATRGDQNHVGTKSGKMTVPHPKKDLPLPTVRSILKQAGL